MHNSYQEYLNFAHKLADAASETSMQYFRTSLDVDNNFTGGILGLNDPRGATRKSQLYHEKVVSQKSSPVAEVPWIDSKDIPQGLAGNSAYIIKPSAAEHLIEKIKHIGLWPNDALMCKQLFPWLQQAYPYYTTVQGIKSSTTL